MKKSTEQVQNNVFLASILQGKSGNIYKEIKKFRGQQRTVSSRIDGEVGSKQIADHFADKYQDLYGKCELGQDFTDLKNTIDKCLDDGDIDEVMSIYENVVKEALKRMKGGKASLELKGGETKMFALFIMFKKIISCIYEKNYFGDRVPFSRKISPP